MSRVPQHRDILAIAIPMLIANLATPLIGLFNTFLAGHMGKPTQLAAVGVAAVYFDFIYWSLGFLRMGTTGLTARAQGEANDNKQIVIGLHAVGIALVLGLLLILFNKPLLLLAQWLIPTSTIVKNHISTYFSWRILAAPAVLMQTALSGWLIGKQKARIAMRLVWIQCVLIVVANLFFVSTLHYGVVGMAIGDLCAQYLSLSIAAIVVLHTVALPPLRRWVAYAMQPGLRQLLQLNRDIMLRTLCLIIALGFFTYQSTQFGALVLATNSLLMNLQAFMAYLLDGFANAAEALVGDAIGKNDRASFDASVRRVAVWCLWVALACSVCLLLWGQDIIALLTNLEQIRALANDLLPLIILLPLVGAWPFLVDGIYVGATLGPEMRNTMLVTLFCIYLPSWYLWRSLGNVGLWLTLYTFYVGRAVTMWIWLKYLLKRGQRLCFSK